MSERFGRYELLEPIAEGGMGEVWRARYEAGLGLGKVVALKRIAERLSDDPEFVAMFVEEARVSLLLSHPNIVQVFDAGREGGRLYLAMELVEGRNLHETIRRSLAVRRQALPVAHALTVAVEVLRGLEHAHRRRGADGRRLNLVHRDVSPGNVLLSYEGAAKLADFGLAKSAIRAYQSTFGTIKGKAAYMAPEQARGEPLDARADLFSLGAVLYEMLAGRGPYAGADSDRDALDRARSGAHPPLASLRPDLAPELAALVEQALAPRPEARFASAADMRGALEAWSARAGETLSEAAVGAFVVDLFQARAATVPPHPFAQALGAGLGLGLSAAGAATAPLPARLTDPAQPVQAAPSGAVASNPSAPAAARVTAPVAAARVTAPVAAARVTAPVAAGSDAAPGHDDEAVTDVVRPRARGRRLVALGVGAAAIGAVLAAALLWRPDPAPPAPAVSPEQYPARAAPTPARPGVTPVSAARPPVVQVDRAGASPVATRREAPAAGAPAPSERPARGGRPRSRDEAAAKTEAASSSPPTVPPPLTAPAPAVAPTPAAGSPARSEPDAVVSFGASPWAEVIVDGRRQCRSTLACRDQKLTPGQHRVRFENPSGLCRELTVYLETGPNKPVSVELEHCP